jgi:hypothetical protein
MLGSKIQTKALRKWCRRRRRMEKMEIFFVDQNLGCILMVESLFF